MPAPCRNTIVGRPASKARPPVPIKTSDPFTARRILAPLRGAQRLPEILDDIGCGFEPDRNPDQFLADAGGSERGLVHLLMRRARRMDHQRLGVTDIGEMARQPHRLDEFSTGRASALDAE